VAKKRKTLPKNFGELLEAGDIPALKAVFDSCELDACGGYSKEPALSFYRIPEELLRWLVEQGADINAKDRYQETPLHSHAGMYDGKVDVLLELGADIEARDYQERTPLHMAAWRFRRHAVRSLLAHGANVHATDAMRQTPLALALAACRNCDISAAVEIAALLLEAGTQVTPEMTEQVQRIGKEFEFHRENFNQDSLAETDAGLARLYALFQVAPIAKRRVHDGVSRITVTATRWEDQHAELWDWLVPGQGSAQTAQGEAIRITGRVANEILGNGGANWDADYRKMLDALLQHFASGTPLDAADFKEASTLVKRIYAGDGNNDELAYLSALAVRWVLANPQPIPLARTNYRR
jgi:hypothetical protein